MTDRKPQNQDKFIVRLPDGMRERIKALADANKRSMNAEVLQALDMYLAYEEGLADIEKAREGMWENNEYHAPDQGEKSWREIPATKGDVDDLMQLIQRLLHRSRV